jgi:hypothetical protein
MYLVQRLYKGIKVSYAGDLGFEPAMALETARDQEHYDQNVQFLGSGGWTLAVSPSSA